MDYAAVESSHSCSSRAAMSNWGFLGIACSVAEFVTVEKTGLKQLPSCLVF